MVDRLGVFCSSGKLIFYFSVETAPVSVTQSYLFLHKVLSPETLTLFYIFVFLVMIHSVVVHTVIYY